MTDSRSLSGVAASRPGWRKTLACALTVALLSGLVAMAPAALRWPGSTAAADAPAKVTAICGGAGSFDAQWSTPNPSMAPFVAAVWVPSGGTVQLNAHGWVSAGLYFGDYKEDSNIDLHIKSADDSQQYKGTSMNLSGIHTSSGPWQWTWNPNLSWTNPNPAGVLVRLSTNLSYAGPAYGNRWTVDVTVAGGGTSVIPPCNSAAYNLPNPAGCGCSTKVGDPVNVVAGNFYDSWTDVSIPGRGPALSSQRTYSSSSAAVDGALGYGWRSSYLMSLAPSAGVVTVTQENGSTVDFFSTSTGWEAPPRFNATLTQVNGTTFKFVRNGTQQFTFVSGQLTSISDLSGNTTTLAYSGVHLATVTDPSGRVLTFAWLGTHISSITEPSTILATGGAAATMVVAYTYDAAGNLATVIDPANGRWTYGYDTAHRITTVREPRNDAAPASAVTTNHYDSSGRVDWQTDALGRQTTLDYSGLTTANNSVNGQVKVTDPDTHVAIYEVTNGIVTGLIKNPGASQSHWLYEIDPATLGRTKSTDPNGIVTTATYNGVGLPLTTTNATGTTARVYNAQGLPTSIADPSGMTTLTYDAGTDRVRTVSRPIAPGTGTSTQTFSYTDPANPGLVTSMVDVRGKTWTYIYDSAGNLVQSTDPLGKRSTTTYNSQGWPLTSVAPNGNDTGGVPAQQTTSIQYDKHGAVVSKTDPTGAVTAYDHDLSGKVTARRDPVPSGSPVKQTNYTYNYADELVSVQRPDNSVLTTDYWGTGAVKAQHDGAGNVTNYTYDAQARLSTTADPDGRVTTLGYDPAGRVVTKQQPTGNCAATPKTGCITYTYTGAGAPASITYSDGVTPNVSYTYDYVNRTKIMTDSAGSSTWVYDSLGRLTSFADPSGAVSYGFTDAGPATSVTYPGGKTLTRGFDDAGRQTATTGWTGGTATYGYDANSSLTTINSGASTGVEDTFGFDQANRPTAYTLRKDTTVLGSLTYTRDPQGRVKTSAGTGLPGATDTLGYNPVDMLASDSSGAYTYDGADNLTGLPDGTRQQFDPAGQICYSSTSNTAACASPPTGATKFSFDGRGNRTATTPANLTPTQLSYDQANRLVSASVPTAPDGSDQYHDISGAPVYVMTNQNIPASPAQPPTPIQILGVTPVPPTGVGSVVVRLTAHNALGYGTVTAAPNGTVGTVNGIASMYVDPGQYAATLAISTLDAAGKIQVSSSQALTLTVELVGWYTTTPDPNGLTFTAITPYRAFQAQINPGTANPVQVQGVAGIPPGVSAVAVNLHSVSPAGTGFLTAWGTGTAPGTASLSFNSADSSALTIVPVADNGQFLLNTNWSATYALADIVGWYSKASSGGGNIAHIVTPSVLASTAGHTGVCTPSTSGTTCNRMTAGSTINVQVTGLGGIPAGKPTSVAVILHASTPKGAGWVGAYQPGTTPTGTDLVFDATDTFVSAATMVPVDKTTGTITLYASVDVDVEVEAVGWFEPAAQTYTYTYAGDGLRRTKTAPDGTTTTFTWDRSTAVPELLAEFTHTPGTTANDKTIRYLYGPDGTVTADITTVGTTDTLRWYHHDQLGSTRALTDVAGNTVGSYAYTPYGKPTSSTGGFTAIGWAGQYTDSETGYTYLRARYYDPATGQFLTRDPLESVTRSAYGYTGNNPINRTDPMGLDWGPIGWAADQISNLCIDTGGNDSCDSIAEQHPGGTQQIVDFGGGVLKVNPITAFLPLDLQGHGVNTSSGSASLGRLSMAAFQTAFGWSNVPIAVFNTGSGVVNAFSACLGISGAHCGGSAFSSVVGFHSVLGNMFGLPFVSNFYNALSNFMGAAPWGQGDC